MKDILNSHAAVEETVQGLATDAAKIVHGLQMELQHAARMDCAIKRDKVQAELAHAEELMDMAELARDEMCGLGKLLSSRVDEMALLAQDAERFRRIKQWYENLGPEDDAYASMHSDMCAFADALPASEGAHQTPLEHLEAVLLSVANSRELWAAFDLGRHVYAEAFMRALKMFNQQERAKKAQEGA